MALAAPQPRANPGGLALRVSPQERRGSGNWPISEMPGSLSQTRMLHPEYPGVTSWLLYI